MESLTRNLEETTASSPFMYVSFHKSTTINWQGHWYYVINDCSKHDLL